MDETPLDTSRAAPAVAALLAWLGEAGVGDIVQDTPRDRFAETKAEAEARARARGADRPPVEAGPAAAPALSRSPAPSVEAPPAPAPAPQSGALPAYASTQSEAEAIDDARARARTAATLDELQAAFESFQGCNLRLTARSLVFGNGAVDADLMIVGEAPGREEDEAGVPFVGRSGRLLDRMLAAIGLEREAVRVTNTVPWRPPGNRSPTPAETEMCLPFTLRQIELVRPKVLVCLGSPAAKALLSSEEGIMRLRGKWTEMKRGDDLTIAATAMLHPAYLLRQPAQKRLAWRDLLAVKARLG